VNATDFIRKGGGPYFQNEVTKNKIIGKRAPEGALHGQKRCEQIFD
jgi:hypothetical protein